MAPRSRLLALTLGTILLLTPQLALAGAGAQLLADFISNHIIGTGLVIFEALALIYAFYYGLKMILSSGSESAYSEAGNSFLYGIIGFAIVATSQAFVAAFFTPGGTPVPAPLIGALSSATSYLIAAAAGVFTLMATLLGLQLLAAQGDSGEMEKVQKTLVMNVIGLMVCMLAYAIVGTVSQADPGILIEELGGIAQFLLIIIGGVSVLALIAAGVFLIVSVDESLRDRAKRALTGTLIVVAIVLSSYTLLATFL